MSVSVRCPCCNHLDFVQPEDLLTACVTCFQCGTTYAPTGPEPEPLPLPEAPPGSSPELVPTVMPEPAASPAPPRSRGPRRPRPQPEETDPQPASRRGRWVLVGGLLTLVLVGVGVGAVAYFTRFKVEPTRYTTPDGDEFTVQFPGRPKWTDIPQVSPPAKGYVWDGGEGTHPHEVWVWTIPPDEREKETDSALAATYAGKAAGTLGGASFGQNSEGIWVGTKDSKKSDPVGWRDPNVNLRNPPRGRVWFGVTHPEQGVGAVKVMIIGNKAYAIRVRGPDLGFDDPEVKTFFDSFRPAELDSRPPPAEAPEDDLRPLARIDRRDAPAWQWRSPGGVAFAQTREAVFFSQYTRAAEGEILVQFSRYHYPSFKHEGEWKLASKWTEVSFVVGKGKPLGREKRQVSAEVTDELVADPSGKRLYAVVLNNERGSLRDYLTYIAAFDVPASPAAGQAVLVPHKRAAFPGRIRQLRVSPDGKNVYALHQHRNKTELVCVETEGMTVAAARLTIPYKHPVDYPKTCLTPDGKRLYVSAGDIHEIDVESWEVRRKFPARGGAWTLACAPDGKLFEFADWTLFRTDPTAPGTPSVQKFTFFDMMRVDGYVVSPNGKRLYITSRGERVFSMDIHEAVEFGRFVAAPKSALDPAGGIPPPMKEMGDPLLPKREKIAPGGVISPDGKCLIFPSGQVYWLAGAGPLPEVDPAVKWKP